MAGYGYGYGAEYGSREKSSFNGYDRSKENYSSDHVCRPVILDSEGRKRPIISYTHNHTPTENYIMKSEIEHVHHKQNSPANDYAISMEKLGINSSYPNQNYPQKVEEFITTIQTEVTRPVKFGPLSANQWRQSSIPANGNGFDDNYNKKSDDYYKPSNNSVKNQYYEDYYNKPTGNSVKNQYSDDYYRTENAGGGGRTGRPIGTAVEYAAARQPNHVKWAAPVSQDLSRPTNDISAAVEFLKEAVKPFSGAGSEIIDSREASRRYGNFGLAPRPYGVRESYSSDITNREATKKYGGAAV